MERDNVNIMPLHCLNIVDPSYICNSGVLLVTAILILYVS